MWLVLINSLALPPNVLESEMWKRGSNPVLWHILSKVEANRIFMALSEYVAAFDLGGRLSFSGETKMLRETNMAALSERPLEHSGAVIVEASVSRAWLDVLVYLVGPRHPMMSKPVMFDNWNTSIFGIIGLNSPWKWHKTGYKASWGKK